MRPDTWRSAAALVDSTGCVSILPVACSSAERTIWSFGVFASDGFAAAFWSDGGDPAPHAPETITPAAIRTSAYRVIGILLAPLRGSRRSVEMPPCHRPRPTLRPDVNARRPAGEGVR